MIEISLFARYRVETGASIALTDAKHSKSDTSTAMKPIMTVTTSDTVLPTVSRAFLDDWLSVLHLKCTPDQVLRFLDETSLAGISHPLARVTHDQIVRLYQLVAVETGDEMMGLWSRPIRSGALKHLCATVRDASSLSAAMFRFTTYWNLLLDDYTLTLDDSGDHLKISLTPRSDAPAQRFGHMLLLKLVHGIGSWLTGRELPVLGVNFAFARPDFAEDYAILFPAPVSFGHIHSAISFDISLAELPVARSNEEMHDFLIRAPRDWIFTTYREHALPLRVREYVQLSDALGCTLNEAALALNLTPRTFMRRLDAEGTSFQGIKDSLRRDIAIRDLTLGHKSIEAISQDLGFATPANLHRAFKRWTGVTPGAYRKYRRTT
jgi:AraC-like DNA-binding protein